MKTILLVQTLPAGMKTTLTLGAALMLFASAQAQLRLGLCELKQGNKPQAISALERLTQDFPDKDKLLALVEPHMPQLLDDLVRQIEKSVQECHEKSVQECHEERSRVSHLNIQHFADLPNLFLLGSVVLQPFPIARHGHAHRRIFVEPDGPRQLVQCQTAHRPSQIQN